jgi:hypothetical protein
VSPVYYATADYVDFYWISAPDTRHSRNLAVRSEVSMVIFNSSRPPSAGRAEGVYLSATAAEVTGPDFDRGLEIYPGPPSRGVRDIAADEMRPPGPFRLFRARAYEHWVLCARPPAGVPCEEHGLAHDHRASVTL